MMRSHESCSLHLSIRWSQWADTRLLAMSQGTTKMESILDLSHWFLTVVLKKRCFTLWSCLQSRMWGTIPSMDWRNQRKDSSKLWDNSSIRWCSTLRMGRMKRSCSGLTICIILRGSTSSKDCSTVRPSHKVNCRLSIQSSATTSLLNRKYMHRLQDWWALSKRNSNSSKRKSKRRQMPRRKLLYGRISSNIRGNLPINSILKSAKVRKEWKRWSKVWRSSVLENNLINRCSMLQTQSIPSDSWSTTTKPTSSVTLLNHSHPTLPTERSCLLEKPISTICCNAAANWGKGAWVRKKKNGGTHGWMLEKWESNCVRNCQKKA